MPKAEDKNAPAGPADKGLHVIPKIAGFRRGGFAWPAEGKTVPLDQLTVEQAEQITGESNLVTQVVDIEAPKAEKAAASKAK